MKKIIGPFLQIVDTSGIGLKGPASSDELIINQNAGIFISNGKVEKIGNFKKMIKDNPTVELDEITEDAILLPGFIDAHTHICWAGDRTNDYALRMDGKTYLEIAAAGGGIWHTVQQTRNSSQIALENGVVERAHHLLKNGITTIEVKSGYGLGVEEELKILRAINNANTTVLADLIPTCLAAHMKPKDFDGSNIEYLKMLVKDLLPQIKVEDLAKRIDIFIEKSAFNSKEAIYYLSEAKKMGFDLTVHGDQFTTNGSNVAVQLNALSVDHLEASGTDEIEMIAHSNTIAVALPGASIGLGMKFTPARKILDNGGCVAIASDWNPGSAPMGDLLIQACILSVYEKLSVAETLAGLTSRAAAALGLNDRGLLQKGQLADFQAYPVKDYRSIFYHQGQIKPFKVWKNGVSVLKIPRQ